MTNSAAREEAYGAAVDIYCTEGTLRAVVDAAIDAYEAELQRQSLDNDAKADEVRDWQQMYVGALERSHQWMDLVLQNAAAGDWVQLVEDVGDCLNNVDAVDDETIALWNQAKATADSTQSPLNVNPAIMTTTPMFEVTGDQLTTDMEIFELGRWRPIQGIDGEFAYYPRGDGSRQTYATKDAHYIARRLSTEETTGEET